MSLAALADEDLMQLVRRGDTLAFEVVYERHTTAAVSLAYRMTGKRNLAEDVVQEAFPSLWRSGARYDRTRGSVRTWVLGIFHNRASDVLRRSMVHDRRRASDEGIEVRLDSGERTGVEPRARDRRSARPPPARAPPPPRRGRNPPRGVAEGADPRDRDRVLRRLHP